MATGSGRSTKRIMSKKNQIAGLYDLGDTLGEGHYAVVKIAKHVFTGETVAVKVIDKMKLDAATRLQMLQEVRLMKLVQHPYVVRLYEVIDTQTKLYLILEFADGGDMYDYIMKHDGGLDEQSAKKYFRQIVIAIQYCHKLHVVHRDLKPENVVFFEKTGTVKLTDFGFSNKFRPGERLQTSCGSLAYSAPEILLGDAYDAPAVDIWSLGVILYMLVCGSAPFQEANDSETLTMIMDCKYTFPTHISQGCRSLISRMLQRQPEHRASLDDIIRDPWLYDGQIAMSDDELLPLATKEHLSEEDHGNILQRMVAGAIAHREDIIEALDRNEYNHITATYFLLAERKLRAQRINVAMETDEKLVTSQPSSPSTETPSQSIALSPRKVHRRSQTSMVDHVLSPTDSTLSSAVDSSLSPNIASGLILPRAAAGGIVGLHPPSHRLRKCSIVEEEVEEENSSEGEQQRKGRPKSRHSSNSSLYLDLRMNADLRRSCSSDSDKMEAPAPFPVSSQIGTGGLSRQGSLRKSGGETSNSSPTSERKSVPESPTTPPGSGSAASSSHGSPARFKISMPNRKLVSTRSSPQLVPMGPVLNQIHEESEELSSSLVSLTTVSMATGAAAPLHSTDPVDEFASSAAGAALLKRLEQRRRLKLLKSRTTPCSSSDEEEVGDAQPCLDLVPSLESPSAHERHHSIVIVSSNSNPDNDAENNEDNDEDDDNNDEDEEDEDGNDDCGSQGSGRGRGSGGCGNHPNQLEPGDRILSGRNDNLGSGAEHHHDTKAGSTSYRHRVRQSHSLNRISELNCSESDSDATGTNCDLLNLYLDSLTRPRCSSRDHSSDAESSQNNRRLNKIQEECCRTLNNDHDGLLEEGGLRYSGVHANRLKRIKRVYRDPDDTNSVKSCDVRSNKERKHVLHRAHSCGSILNVKERALLRRRLQLWEDAAAAAASAKVNNNELSLALTSAASPISVLHIQGASRCCSLC